jgi:hypothetical protein
MLSFPAGKAKVEKAIDAEGNTIGVSIIMLVIPEDFDKLPGVFQSAAHQTYAAPRRS